MSNFAVKFLENHHASVTKVSEANVFLEFLWITLLFVNDFEQNIFSSTELKLPKKNERKTINFYHQK